MSVLVRLTRPVRGLGGPVLPAGVIVEAQAACDGVMEVRGFGWCPLNPEEYELYVVDGEFAALLEEE